MSSQKLQRNSILKLKTTRFQLPASEEKMRMKLHGSIESSAQYINVSYWSFKFNEIRYSIIS